MESKASKKDLDSFKQEIRNEIDKIEGFEREIAGQYDDGFKPNGKI